MRRHVWHNRFSALTVIVLCCSLVASFTPLCAFAGDLVPGQVAGRLEGTPHLSLVGDLEDRVSVLQQSQIAPAPALRTQNEPYAPIPVEGSLDGLAYTVLLDEGELVFFRSWNYYRSKTRQTVVDLNGNEYTGMVCGEFETLSTITSPNDVPWYANRSSITSIRFADGQRIRPVNCSYWFFLLSNVTSIDLSGLDTSMVQHMDYMFYSLPAAVTSLDVTRFDTSNVTTMSWMFASCVGLSDLDVTHFDTSNVTDMSFMFNHLPKQTFLDVTRLNTSKVTTMESMFQGVYVTDIDLSNLDTSHVTTMESMFQGCRYMKSIDVSTFDTSNVTNMSWMFRHMDALQELDLSTFDTSNVTTFERMFDECNAMTTLDLSSFDTSKAASMDYILFYCRSLTTVKLGPKFTFKGNGSMAAPKYSVLPNPPSEDRVHNGKWVTPIPGVLPQYTPAELRDQYDGGTMAGTYVWAVAANNVAYEANGGRGYMVAERIPVGETYTVPLCDYTRNGYVFAGWNTQADGSGIDYPVGESLIPTANVTLFAQWAEPRIVVDITDAAAFDLEPLGALIGFPDGGISFTNRGNVDVCVSGIRVRPAGHLALSSNPMEVGEYDAWFAPAGGSAIRFSDYESDGFVAPEHADEWVIPQGETLMMVDAGGMTAGIEMISGVSRVAAGSITWQFTVRGS